MSEATETAEATPPAEGGLKPGDVVVHKSIAWADEPGLWVVAKAMEDGSLECRTQVGVGELATETFEPCELQAYRVRHAGDIGEAIALEMEPHAVRLAAAGRVDLAYKLRLAVAEVAEVLKEVERAAAAAK